MDPHLFSKLDLVPHSLKKLEPDLLKVNGDLNKAFFFLKTVFDKDL
jgi:hypothetical protein